MKIRYLLAITILLCLFGTFEAGVIFWQLASRPWLDAAIRGASIFVALIAAVIALHASDKKERRVKARIEVALDDTETRTYKVEDLPEPLKKSLTYAQKEVRSDQVHFKITNESGFTLKEPTVSFRLPIIKQHPHRLEDGTWVLTFNSNLYNSRAQLRTLQFGDTAIVSNSNLPYWNHGEQIVIWIRMALDVGGADTFYVQVTLNASNAQGETTPVAINPRALKA
jgi:hypothetical protein